MNNIFYKCSSLYSCYSKKNKEINNTIILKSNKNILYFPDISKWNTSKVKNMSFMFFECSSLINMPDISKWDMHKVTDISYMFSGCSSLSYLPDISKWNINNIKKIKCLFEGCLSLSSFPDISKWDIYITKLTELNNIGFINSSSNDDTILNINNSNYKLNSSYIPNSDSNNLKESSDNNKSLSSKNFLSSNSIKYLSNEHESSNALKKDYKDSNESPNQENIIYYENTNNEFHNYQNDDLNEYYEHFYQ